MRVSVCIQSFPTPDGLFCGLVVTAYACLCLLACLLVAVCGFVHLFVAVGVSLCILHIVILSLAYTKRPFNSPLTFRN